MVRSEQLAHPWFKFSIESEMSEQAPGIRVLTGNKTLTFECEGKRFVARIVPGSDRWEES